MSQIIKSVASTPSVPTAFVTDSGTVIPSANTVNVNGGSTSANSNNGIQVIANPTGSNNEVIQLTNRFQGTTTTVGAVTNTVITFPLGATPGTYFFEFLVSGFNASGPAGAGYQTYTTIRTSGSAGHVIGDTDSITHEDASLLLTTANATVSGNNMIFQVGGVAGLTIDWNVVGSYILVT